MSLLSLFSAVPPSPEGDLTTATPAGGETSGNGIQAKAGAKGAADLPFLSWLMPAAASGEPTPKSKAPALPTSATLADNTLPEETTVPAQALAEGRSLRFMAAAPRPPQTNQTSDSREAPLPLEAKVAPDPLIEGESESPAFRNGGLPHQTFPRSGLLPSAKPSPQQVVPTVPGKEDQPPSNDSVVENSPQPARESKRSGPTTSSPHLGLAEPPRQSAGLESPKVEVPRSDSPKPRPAVEPASLPATDPVAKPTSLPVTDPAAKPTSTLVTEEAPSRGSNPMSAETNPRHPAPTYSPSIAPTSRTVAPNKPTVAPAEPNSTPAPRNQPTITPAEPISAPVPQNQPTTEQGTPLHSVHPESRTQQTVLPTTPVRSIETPAASETVAVPRSVSASAPTWTLSNAPTEMGEGNRPHKSETTLPTEPPTKSPPARVLAERPLPDNPVPVGSRTGAETGKTDVREAVQAPLAVPVSSAPGMRRGDIKNSTKSPREIRSEPTQRVSQPPAEAVRSPQVSSSKSSPAEFAVPVTVTRPNVNGESGMGYKNTPQLPDNKPDIIPKPTFGINPAYTASIMPASSATTSVPVDAPLANSTLGVDKAEWMEVIKQVESTAAKLAGRNAERMTLNIELESGRTLRVRLQLNDGQARAVFDADVGDARSDLVATWKSMVSNQTRGSISWADPVFQATSSDASGGDALAGDRREFASAQQDAFSRRQSDAHHPGSGSTATTHASEETDESGVATESSHLLHAKA